jgi:hypothetical protein
VIWFSGFSGDDLDMPPPRLWRRRIRSNKYAEFWFNINWQKRGNDEIRNHPVLEQRR